MKLPGLLGALCTLRRERGTSRSWGCGGCGRVGYWEGPDGGRAWLCAFWVSLSPCRVAAGSGRGRERWRRGGRGLPEGPRRRRTVMPAAGSSPRAARRVRPGRLRRRRRGHRGRSGAGWAGVGHGGIRRVGRGGDPDRPQRARRGSGRLAGSVRAGRHGLAARQPDDHDAVHRYRGIDGAAGPAGGPLRRGAVGSAGLAARGVFRVRRPGDGNRGGQLLRGIRVGRATRSAAAWQASGRWPATTGPAG